MIAPKNRKEYDALSNELTPSTQPPPKDPVQALQRITKQLAFLTRRVEDLSDWALDLHGDADNIGELVEQVIENLGGVRSPRKEDEDAK